MKLYFKKLSENAIIPERKTQLSAGLDLCACIGEDINIAPGEIKKIPTKLAVEPEDKNCVLLIYARSGLAINHGIALANSVGVIDSDYRGEICIGLINLGKETFTVSNGMRIAQLVVQPCVFAQACVAAELSETQRGSGGFGSTGIN